MSRGTLIAAGFVLLFVLHQDFWWKSDSRIVLGFLPVSLAYHVVWTLLIAVGWFLVARFCWPKELDDEETAPAKMEKKPGQAGSTR
jgi:hypothetical protein